MTKLSIIQIGLGSWGRRWAEVVRASSEFRPAGYISRTWKGPEWAKDMPVFPCLSDALRFVQADALLVTTPHFCHAHDVAAGLTAGLHVLVEKPMADTLSASRQMLAQADNSGKLLMVSEDFRYNPAPRTVWKLIADGAIGKPELLLIHYFRPHSFPAGDWRNEMTHPLLLENGVHHFDLLRYLTGSEAQNVFAVTWQAEGTAIKNTAAAVTITLKNGSVAVYTAAWAYGSVQTDWLGQWKIVGSHGAICWEGAMGQVLWLDRGGIVHDVPLLPMERRSLDAVLAEFGRAIRTGTSPETSGTDNFRSFSIAMAAIESADRGQPVTLAQD